MLSNVSWCQIVNLLIGCGWYQCHSVFLQRHSQASSSEQAFHVDSSSFSDLVLRAKVDSYLPKKSCGCSTVWFASDSPFLWFVTPMVLCLNYALESPSFAERYHSALSNIFARSEAPVPPYKGKFTGGLCGVMPPFLARNRSFLRNIFLSIRSHSFARSSKQRSCLLAV